MGSSLIQGATAGGQTGPGSDTGMPPGMLLSASDCRTGSFSQTFAQAVTASRWTRGNPPGGGHGSRELVWLGRAVRARAAAVAKVSQGTGWGHREGKERVSPPGVCSERSLICIEGGCCSPYITCLSVADPLRHGPSRGLEFTRAAAATWPPHGHPGTSRNQATGPITLRAPAHSPEHRCLHL